MKRVLLFDPPMQSIMRARADWFPMGLAYLAGAALREGHKVLVYNGEHDRALDYVNLTTYASNYHLYPEALNDPQHSVWRKIRLVMDEFKPDLVGITSFSVKIPSALRIAAIAKDYNSRMPVILGGQHATIMTDEVLAHSNVDFVVRGEGEDAFCEILREIDNGQRWGNILGLSWKDAGSAVHNAPRPLKTNLDELAHPSRESLYDVENYAPHALGKLFTSRGCPFKCNYCGTQNIWTQKLRMHSPTWIVDEITHAKNSFGVGNFTFLDDVFGIDKKRTMPLLRAMNDARLGITWDCLTRADVVSDELLAAMKSAGCTKIDMGVESGSDRILLDTQKGLTIEQIVAGANLVKKHGIFLYGFFMIGLPAETEEDMEKTKRLLLALKPNWAGISIFTPIPGTGQWKRLVEAGKIPGNTHYELLSHQSPNSNFAFGMADRGRFPERAQETLKFIEGYNGSWRNVLRRALSRRYHRNPKQLWHDVKRFLTWKGVLRASHQGAQSKDLD